MGYSPALTSSILLAVASLRLQDSAPRSLPPPKPIAGIAGFESVSTLLYPGALDHPHELRATYVFPERVRWQISVKDEKGDERILQYRSGEVVYRLPSRSAVSEVCTGADRDQTLLQMEMRRALMLYPDGFDWKGTGPERRADLGTLGSLFVLGANATDKKPTELGDAGSDGKTIDSYKAIQWREKDGRAWPAAMELWHTGELAWRETVESVETRGRFVDSFFTPPDRRDRSGAQPTQGSIRELDLPSTCSLRVEIAKGSTWDTALAELARLRSEWSTRLAQQKLELEPIATLETSKDGDPTAVLLRLSIVPENPPAGFLISSARKGVAVAVGGVKEASPAQIADLRKALPKGSAEGNPYVRFDLKTGSEGRVVVVLPYAKVN